MPPSPHTPPGAPSARHTAKEGGHDPTSPAFPASPASASSADVSPFITSPLSAHSPLSSIASPPYLPSSPTPHRGLPDGVSQGQRQRMRAESPGISDSPLSSSPSQLEDSFIVIPPDHPTRAHRHRQSHNQGQHDPRGPSKHWERRLGDASDLESDEGDEEEEAGEGEGTDIETDSTVSTAPGTDLGTETETETDLTLGLEGLSDTSSLGTGGDGDSLAGSLHDWVGGEAVQAARMSGHADAQIAYHRDQHTGGIDAIPNVRPFYNHQQGFKGYPNSPGQSSMDDSYIDAEASDYTYDPTLSPARSATSARALHQATGVNDDGAEDDTGVDANADMDRTPGASQIVVIMPQLSASFSTSSLGSKAGSLTPSGSTYGLLAGKKAGPVVGKVSERHDGVRGQDAGPAVPFREERGEEQEQGRGKQGQVKGLFRFFSPSSAPAHSAPPLPLIRGYTDPTQMRTRTANPAPSARSDPFRLADMPTEHSRDGLAEKYREDKEAAGYKGRGKIPDSWLADARIWAPHAEEVDGTRSEVPDYSVLASRESLWPSTFRKRLDGAGADNGGGEAEGDEFGMVNFGEKLVQCGNQGEGAVVVGNGARRWVVGDIREGKKWSLLALASILSVALLGSFGSKIPLSLLFPEGVLNRTQQAATAGRTPIDVPTGAAASASAGYASTQSAAAAYAAYLTGTGSAESDTAQQTTAANRQTTGFAPMALATQLLPDLEAIKSVFATLTSASNHLTLTDDETVTEEGRRVRYASDGKTLAEDESTASDLMSAGGSQAVGLVTRPSETAVAVSVSMPDKGYKAWAKALRDQIRAQTAVVPTVFTSPVVHHAAAVENTTEQVSLRRTNPFNVFIATTTPIISSASHALLSGAVWTRSIMLTALRSLLDALSEDLARLSTLYNSLHRPNITADIFSPTTHALLAIGAHIGHTADAAAYRVKSLHRAIVSFEETREREHTAAIHYIASELGKKWGDARDSVVLGAREEGEKMMDVARGIKAYLDHLEDASMGAVGQVGKGVRGKWEGAGTRMEGVKKGVREKVQSASQGFVRAVGDGFRKGTGAVVDLADILSSSAPDAVTDQSVFKGEKAEGQVTDDMSTRVHLQKTAWWARQGNRQPQPRATRQYTQRQRVERLPRRWSRRAREPPASGKCGSSTAEKEQGRGRRGSNASGTGTSTGVRGKRRDAALVPAKARLEPYELARIKEMWKGIKRGPRSRFRKVVDQIYHGVMPFVLG